MSGAAGSFIDKQLGREPAWRLLPLFANGLAQPWLPAWVALLGELDQAIFERSDARVAQTKLAWWGKDLAAGQSAQHPLSRALLAAPRSASIGTDAWQALAHDALRLSLVEHAPRDWQEARVLCQPLAESVARVEGALIGHPVCAQSVALQWRRQRLWWSLLQEAPAQSLMPLGAQAALARGEPSADLWRDFSAAQADDLAVEATADLSLHRALLRQHWQWRLPRLREGLQPAKTQAPGAVGLLWRSWRAAVKVARS